MEIKNLPGSYTSEPPLQERVERGKWRRVGESREGVGERRWERGREEESRGRRR